MSDIFEFYPLDTLSFSSDWGIDFFCIFLICYVAVLNLRAGGDGASLGKPLSMCVVANNFFK